MFQDFIQIYMVKAEIVENENMCNIFFLDC